MTKKQFLLKLNICLVSVPTKRRDEILNHYRSVIDQSMVNGNTEESSVEALGNVTNLSKLILRKEKKTILVPVIIDILKDIFVVIKILLMLALMALLVGVVGLAVTSGYSLVLATLEHFVPTSLMLSSNLFGAMFRAGACVIVVGVLVVLLAVIKSAICAIFKLITHLTNMVKDGVYMIQSKKFMKEAFKGESVN